MKKYANIVIAVLDLIIVFAALFLNIWSYASGGYNNWYSWNWGSMSTIQLFDKGMYGDGILIFALVLSFVGLVIAAILNFQNKKEKLAKKFQIIASVLIMIMFILVHIGIFEFYSDYSICELNNMGFVVIGLCVIDIILSIVLMKSKEEVNAVEKINATENTEKTDFSENINNN